MKTDSWLTQEEMPGNQISKEFRKFSAIPHLRDLSW